MDFNWDANINILYHNYNWKKYYATNPWGMLSKLIDSFITSSDEDIKYWLASVLETFLRGNNHYF